MPKPHPATLTRRIEWDMGHRLADGYRLKCSNVHGHRYIAELTFACDRLNEFGMIVDFDVVRARCKKWIDEHLDHGFLACKRDPEMIRFLEQVKSKSYVVDFNTTVENIVVWLAEQLSGVMAAEAADVARGVRLVALRLYETPTAWADWVADAPRR